MGALYVARPGTTVRLRGGRIVVEDPDGRVVAGSALDRLSEVVLVGAVDVTTPALRALLDRDAAVVLLSRYGRLRGVLRAPTGRNVYRRIAQVKCHSDASFRVRLSRDIVSGKIRNSLTLARRWSRQMMACGTEAQTDALALLEQISVQVVDAGDLDELRGLEGQAARLYYSVLRSKLDPKWSFPRRSRRPPGDVPNCLLSVGYSLLTSRAFSALENVGLDPYVGFYHSISYGRPALALDLVEEFRAYLADSIMLTALNRNMISSSCWHESPKGGIWLTTKGWQTLLGQYATRTRRHIRVRGDRKRVQVDRIFDRQARRMARVIDGEELHYRPFRVR